MADYAASSKRSIDGANDDASLKRQRTSPQSRVVFVRGLPMDCLESELLALCCPFAVVEKCLMIPPKHQAFVQLPDAASAANLITFYQSRDAMIRGKKIFLEFSTRDEITSRQDDTGLSDNDSTSAATSKPSPRQGSQYQPAHATPQQQHAPSTSTATRAAPAPAAPGRERPPGTILMATVSKINYDVTADVLQQVFQKFGNVEKIITFWKNNEFKALIQMESPDQASAAQSALDGRDIYTGCNTLHVVSSRHTELHVRFNNERCKDYTNPNLPSLTEASQADQSYQQEPPDRYAPPPQYTQPPAASAPPSAVDRYQQPPAYSRDDEYRPDPRGPPGYDYPPPDHRRDDDPPSMRQLPPHSTGRAIRTDDHRAPCLICSNMDPRLVVPDYMFTFFGCFGDVMRIKVMFRKQDTALIQFADDVHATSALDHLDGVVVFGKKLRVDYSKHKEVSMPRGEVDRFELENTRDYSDSPLHRYRRRSVSEAVPPSSVLHVSDIPMALQRDQRALIDLFARYGYVKNFHHLQKNSKMAIVEMGNLDDAVMALLHLDNLSYPDSHIRISFSKAAQFAGGPGGPLMHLPPPSSGPGGYYGGGGGGYGRSPPRGRGRSRSRSRSRDRGPPPGRDRYRNRSRSRSRDRGGYRERGPPPRRGDMGRGGDNYGRPPPPRRY